MRNRSTYLNRIVGRMLVVAVTVACLTIVNPAFSTAQSAADQYKFWKAVGMKAAEMAIGALPYKPDRPKSNYIVLSNAGYAEVNGQTTMAALDGLSQVTGASRGANNLVEVQSAPRVPLWFAVYDRGSGYCAYLQVDSDELARMTYVPWLAEISAGIFKNRASERISVDYLFQTNPATFAPNFGGNEFRIVSIINGIAAGVPPYIFRSFEFHDHYCPGVSSGILMANYVKAFFTPTETEAWFVQGVQPWCKEDALMVMLNATPGISGYAVTYSTPAGRAEWGKFENASSIIYHKNATDTQWQGVVLGFTFPDGETTGCSKYTDPTVNKLCSDMWLLEKLDDPATIETLMTVYHKFKLPVGKHPKDYAAPGVDVMKLVGGFEPM